MRQRGADREGAWQTSINTQTARSIGRQIDRQTGRHAARQKNTLIDR